REPAVTTSYPRVPSISAYAVQIAGSSSTMRTRVVEAGWLGAVTEQASKQRRSAAARTDLVYGLSAPHRHVLVSVVGTFVRCCPYSIQVNLARYRRHLCPCTK